MPQTLNQDAPIRIGFYLPFAMMRAHTKKSQWDFSMAILSDVLRVYPTAKVEVSSGRERETKRRLEVTGANPDDVQALVLASEQANRHILQVDTARTADVVRILG